MNKKQNSEVQFFSSFDTDNDHLDAQLFQCILPFFNSQLFCLYQYDDSLTNFIKRIANDFQSITKIANESQNESKISDQLQNSMDLSDQSVKLRFSSLTKQKDLNSSKSSYSFNESCETTSADGLPTPRGSIEYEINANHVLKELGVSKFFSTQTMKFLNLLEPISNADEFFNFIDILFSSIYNEYNLYHVQPRDHSNLSTSSYICSITYFFQRILEIKEEIDLEIMQFIMTFDFFLGNQLSFFFKLLELFFMPTPMNMSKSEANLFNTNKAPQIRKRILDIMFYWTRIRFDDILACKHTCMLLSVFARNYICPKFGNLVSRKNYKQLDRLFYFPTKRNELYPKNISHFRISHGLSTKLVNDTFFIHFLKMDPRKIAEIMTYYDYNYLKELSIGDLHLEKKTCFYKKYIERYNGLSVWLQLFILKQNTAALRKEIILKYFLIIKELQNTEFINFEGMRQIHDALFSPAIVRLEKTWNHMSYEKVNKSIQSLMQEWKEKIHRKTESMIVIPAFSKLEKEINYIIASQSFPKTIKVDDDIFFNNETFVDLNNFLIKYFFTMKKQAQHRFYTPELSLSSDVLFSIFKDYQSIRTDQLRGLLDLSKKKGLCLPSIFTELLPPPHPLKISAFDSENFILELSRAVEPDECCN